MAFYPNCTLPTHSVVYMGSANVRGTLDILWSSLGTLIACTYTVLHLNVPEQRTGKRSQLWPSFKWSIVAILAPEVILVKSGGDWMNARKELRHLHRTKPETRKTWKLMHMLFANMGGFVVEYRDAAHRKSRQSSHRSDKPGANPEPPDEPLPTALFHLTAESLRHAVEQGLLPTKIVSIEEILDRSKSNLFTKTVTLAQTLYFLVEFVVRLSRGLSISPLEIGIVGFVVCSAATYGFVLSKPKDVTTCIVLQTYDTQLPDTIRELPCNYDSFFGDLVPGQSIPNDMGGYIDDIYYSWILLLLVSTVLGAIHLGGWNAMFPTPADKWIWRSAALISCVIAPVYAVSAYIARLLPAFLLSWELVGTLLILIYAGSRLVLVAEMFRCLFHLPPEALITTWTNNVPHIG